jgi:hypothetical protein
MTPIEELIRDYLRGDADVMALLNDDPERVNMEYKGNTKATHVTLYRAGGFQHEYAPLDFALVTLHCYGTTRSVAARLADEIARALRAVSNYHAPLQSASVQSLGFLPTGDGTARYAVTTSVTRTLARVA